MDVSWRFSCPSNAQSEALRENGKGALRCERCCAPIEGLNPIDNCLNQDLGCAIGFILVENWIPTDALTDTSMPATWTHYGKFLWQAEHVLEWNFIRTPEAADARADLGLVLGHYHDCLLSHRVN